MVYLVAKVIIIINNYTVLPHHKMGMFINNFNQIALP